MLQLQESKRTSTCHHMKDVTPTISYWCWCLTSTWSVGSSGYRAGKWETLFPVNAPVTNNNNIVLLSLLWWWWLLLVVVVSTSCYYYYVDDNIIEKWQTYADNKWGSVRRCSNKLNTRPRWPSVTPPGGHVARPCPVTRPMGGLSTTVGLWWVSCGDRARVLFWICLRTAPTGGRQGLWIRWRM